MRVYKISFTKAKVERIRKSYYLKIKMNLRTIFNRSWPFLRLRERKPTEIIDLSTVEEVPKYKQGRTEEEEQAILKKRNKSRLDPEHRNILFGQKPYYEDVIWFHNTLLYKRKMLGRYGLEATRVPAGIAWPTVEELQDMTEQENVAYPKTIQEVWKDIEKTNAEMAAEEIARDNEVAAKMAKVDKWIEEVLRKKAQKEMQLEEARIRKEKMMESIRREFGFTMSLKDPRLIELMEKKELELKKQKKQAKKQIQQEQMIKKTLEAAQLLQTSPESMEEKSRK